MKKAQMGWDRLLKLIAAAVVISIILYFIWKGVKPKLGAGIPIPRF